MRRSLLAAALALAAMARAQEALRPMQRGELWLSAAATSQLPDAWRGALGSHYKRLRARAELGYRSTDAFFAGRQAFLDLGGRYRAAKGLFVSVEHRFAARAGTAGLRHRTMFTAEAARRFGRVEARYRFAYQHAFIERGGKREVFRNRLQSGWDIRKWKLDPELSVELFTWAGYRGWSYFGTRWQLGTSYTLAKGHRLAAVLVHDRERDRAWPTHRWIGCFTYTLDLRDL
ncbi:MAG: DUF2490 domain-containing protein [Flavobacteriales bacterium]